MREKGGGEGRMREEIYFCVKEIIPYNDFCALQ